MTTKQYPQILTAKRYVSRQNDFFFVFSSDVSDWQHSRKTNGKRDKERIIYNIENNISSVKKNESKRHKKHKDK